jgi:hypothetical protein
MSTASLSKDLRKKIPKVFDRSLGVFFGMFKTIVVFGLIYSIILNILAYATGEDSEEATRKMPGWFKTSKSRSIIEFSGSLVDPIVEGTINSATKGFDRSLLGGEELDGKIEDIVEDKIDEKVREKLSEEIEETLDENLDDAIEDSGYNKKDIDKMNRLIEIVQ